MLVVLVMLCLSPSKDLELVGKQCLATGAKIGKATLTLMVKHSLSRSKQVMGAVSSPTMWLLPTGALAKPSVVDSFNCFDPGQN